MEESKILGSVNLFMVFFTMVNLDQSSMVQLKILIKCRLMTFFIVRQICFNEKKLHTGIRQTHSTVRQKFWIIKTRRRIRSYMNSCNICRRYRTDTVAQKMGILLAVRVTRPDNPCKHTGVDYAGPVDILRFRGRGSRTYKAYIAVFVCMATKSVHLELVSG